MVPEDDIEVPFKFEEIERTSLHERVANELRKAIFAGTLERGAQLPTERELTESFGVSRATVREAVRSLQAEGLVASSGGRNVVSQGAADSLMQALGRLVQLNHLQFDDLLGLRCVLEMGAVRLAAERAEETHLAEAVAALDTMREHVSEPEAFQEADIQFHVSLARASGNEAIYLVMLAVRDVLSAQLQRHLEELDEIEQEIEVLIAEHETIIQAVRNGDGDTAAHAIEGHLQRFYRQVLPPA